LNDVYGQPVQWMPNSQTLLVQLVPSKRAAPPVAPAVPPGPNEQESFGRATGAATFQDLLKTPHDEALFDYYATAQLALVESNSGAIKTLGEPSIYEDSGSSPDGKHILVTRLHRPYSYLHTASSFPREIEVWDTTGKLVHKVASVPLADNVPLQGVRLGPRSVNWRPTEPSTLVWVEALDGGDPKKKASHRDRIMISKSPFSAPPTEMFKTEHRYSGAQWGEKGGTVLINDFDRDKRWTRTLIVDADNSQVAARTLFSRNISDQYGNPGTPVMKTLSTGHRVILQKGDLIYLTGLGATPEGDRPFLDRLSLQTLKAERLFRSDADAYEVVAAVLNDEASQIVTRRERPTSPPNYHLRTLTTGGELKALTNMPDSTPQLQGIRKQLVKYKRADGVDLSFTLYLPPGYKEGTRLPTVVWAYPLEFTDTGTAGQVTGSTQRYNSLLGYSHLFFLLEGYAILDDATMPVVGDPQTMNDTYVEQIVSSAKAAVDKAVEMGVTDRDRVGVGGHSYGAFMTANLLAHSDIFRAGIARSGAYNRTLTPFGFQSERRTLWEAPETYIKVSPFMVAHKIKEPILLIHGEADNNTGTFPIQSERLYQAIRGTGGTVRLVTLPLESHGYSARESTEHTLYEMITWFNKWVKNGERKREETTEK
jgi:dipeptidyl aminopeptidase/acylaminoacyl peptidase